MKSFILLLSEAIVMLAWFRPMALAEGQPSSETPSPAAVIARELLAAELDSPKNRLRCAFGDPLRRQWRADPAPRPGLILKDMTLSQKERVDRLLKTVLSEVGLSCIRGIRKEQDLIGKHEEGLGADYLWLAIYGEPGEGWWGWRLGGHHLSLHFTYRGSELVSASPMLLGGEIVSGSAGESPGFQELLPREVLARDLVNSLNPEQQKEAKLDGPTPTALAMSEPRSTPIHDIRGGLNLSAANPQQRERAARIVDAYTSLFTVPAAKLIQQHIPPDFESARFSWSGETRDGAACYYRLHGKSFLFEYANSDNHAHTILRTSFDFGGESH